MKKKRRPILLVLVILSGIGLFLGATGILVLKLFTPSSNLFLTEKIGVLTVDGTITSSQKITAQLVKFAEDRSIKAILVRVNSPGGSVGPSQEIYREIQKTVLHKKVVVSMGAVAASGGYYISAAADKIVANPGTITGSIGVLMEFVRLEELMDKIGIDLEIMKTGEFKAMGSPDRKLTESEKEIINELIYDLQRQFVEAIAAGRGLPLEKVRQIADGRIFSGAKAKELGLVDMLGNFQDAVQLTKELAGIRGDVVLVRPEKGSLALLERLMDSGANSLERVLEGFKTRIEYRWHGFSRAD
ncbi:MAG TPA: signal peptide peptidase SppA [Deltaproteobacteria bacterium]|nr:signal peptide peptidase SppA [Deltaproteobacteria bacterium]HIJ20025.1 signal peptide peptidase SppA [Deltaproteobacteria bacterium]HIJ42277.1 signal peptide peptidase SppA [Deltaproteobacteria bacterium]